MRVISGIKNRALFSLFGASQLVLAPLLAAKETQCFYSAFGATAGCYADEHGDFYYPPNQTGGTYHAGCVDASMSNQHSPYGV